MCNAAHNKAYIGRELTYVHSDVVVLPSTEVMTLRVDRSQLPASYVRAYFLSKLGFVQIQSTIRGITAHSYPGDVAILDIYVPEVSESKREEWFACDEKLVQAGAACEIATALNTAAKYLVEALIDGRIDEATIIAASEEIEMDGRSADRAILARLKVDGLDTAGQPLFADLEEMYRLASSANQA
jgi:type I restriction enzyme S subunit